MSDYKPSIRFEVDMLASSRMISTVEVQYSPSREEWRVNASATGPIPAEGARRVAEALIKAADIADRKNKEDCP